MTNMPKLEKEEIILILRGLINSRKSICTLNDVVKDFERETHMPLPFKEFDYATAEEFIESSGQFIFKWIKNDICVEAKPNSKSTHLTNMITKQKSVRNNKSITKKSADMYQGNVSTFESAAPVNQWNRVKKQGFKKVVYGKDETDEGEVDSKDYGNYNISSNSIFSERRFDKNAKTKQQLSQSLPNADLARIDKTSNYMNIESFDEGHAHASKQAQRETLRSVAIGKRSNYSSMQSANKRESFVEETLSICDSATLNCGSILNNSSKSTATTKRPLSDRLRYVAPKDSDESLNYAHIKSADGDYNKSSKQLQVEPQPKVDIENLMNDSSVKSAGKHEGAAEQRHIESLDEPEIINSGSRLNKFAMNSDSTSRYDELAKGKLSLQQLRYAAPEVSDNSFSQYDGNAKGSLSQTLRFAEPVSVDKSSKYSNIEYDDIRYVDASKQALKEISRSGGIGKRLNYSSVQSADKLESFADESLSICDSATLNCSSILNNSSKSSATTKRPLSERLRYVAPKRSDESFNYSHIKAADGDYNNTSKQLQVETQSKVDIENLMIDSSVKSAGKHEDAAEQTHSQSLSESDTFNSGNRLNNSFMNSASTSRYNELAKRKLSSQRLRDVAGGSINESSNYSNIETAGTDYDKPSKHLQTEIGHNVCTDDGLTSSDFESAMTSVNTSDSKYPEKQQPNSQLSECSKKLNQKDFDLQNSQDAVNNNILDNTFRRLHLHRLTNIIPLYGERSDYILPPHALVQRYMLLTDVYKFDMALDDKENLKKYCEHRHILPPQYNIFESNKRYTCSITINNVTYKNHGNEFKYAKMAKQDAFAYVAKIFHEQEERKLWPICADSDEELLHKLQTLFAEHDAGIFATYVPDLFEDKYKCLLPAKWWVLIQTAYNFKLDEVGSNVIITLNK